MLGRTYGYLRAADVRRPRRVTRALPPPSSDSVALMCDGDDAADADPLYDVAAVAEEPDAAELAPLPAATGGDSGQTGWLTWDYHVVYHPAFNVPSLFFTVATSAEGRPLTTEETWAELAAGVDRAAVTPAEHPLTRAVGFHVHPCRTAELMADVLLAAADAAHDQDGGVHEGGSSPVSYTRAWLSLLAPVVGAPLPAAWLAP